MHPRVEKDTRRRRRLRGHSPSADPGCLTAGHPETILTVSAVATRPDDGSAQCPRETKTRANRLSQGEDAGTTVRTATPPNREALPGFFGGQQSHPSRRLYQPFPLNSHVDHREDRDPKHHERGGSQATCQFTLELTLSNRRVGRARPREVPPPSSCRCPGSPAISHAMRRPRFPRTLPRFGHRSSVGTATQSQRSDEHARPVSIPWAVDAPDSRRPSRPGLAATPRRMPRGDAPSTSSEQPRGRPACPRRQPGHRRARPPARDR